MKQLFLFLFVSVFLLAACDDTLRRYDPPSLRISDGDSTYMEFTDSVKNVLKTQHLHKKYSFVLAGFETGEGIAAISYALETGVGELTQNDGTVVTTLITSIVNEQAIHMHFTPAEQTGSYKLTFTPFNRFEMFGEPIVLNLIFFDNLLPVGQLASSPAPEYGNRAFLFDAGASYDRDKDFGGYITTYDYTIDGGGKTIHERNYNAKTHFIFDEPGDYLVSLAVYDNDQGKSEPVTITVTVP